VLFDSAGMLQLLGLRCAVHQVDICVGCVAWWHSCDFLSGLKRSSDPLSRCRLWDVLHWQRTLPQQLSCAAEQPQSQSCSSSLAWHPTLPPFRHVA
jgi:hypothetical protein